MIEVTYSDWELDPIGLIRAFETYRQQAVDEATRPLVEALERVTEHLAVWAGDYPEDRTSETEAAIYCARQALAQHTKAQGPNT